MKIAVIYTNELPNTYANSINTIKHASAFADLGNDVTVFYINKNKESKNINFHDFYDINSKVNFYAFKENFFFSINNLFFRKIYSLIDLISRHTIRYIFDAEKKIAQYIINNKFDFVYARSFRASYYIAKSEIPIIVETHSSNTKNPQLKKLLNLKNNNNLNISTISDILKSNFIKSGIQEKKIIVQEDAVDIERFNQITDNKIKLRKELNLDLNKKIITYSGSLRKGKGIKSIIELAKLFNKNKELIFLIVGGPENSKIHYKNICEKHKLKNIIFTGFIYNKLIIKHLKASDILIMLYSKNEKKMVMDINTTSPIKLFEYMAAKKPIIVSQIPTIEKIVENNTHVLMQKPDDIISAKQNIEKILNDDKLADKLSENAYKKAYNYTYKIRCRNILNFTINN